MRAIKPLRLGFLTRPFDFGREHRFVVTVLAPFPLGEPAALLPEIDLWKLIGRKLGRFTIFDAAMWKPHGEVVVAGSCFPPEAPVLESLIGLEVATASGEKLVDKTLRVIGDRVWDAAGMSAPAPFTCMPVDYAHAFGGEGFDANPIGRGYKATKTEGGDAIHALPNVEDPARPLDAKGERPPPASFAAYDPLWPIHFEKMGTYDAKWRDELFPGFAEDIDWTVFQTVPRDQRLDEYFAGGERIRIKNMHPRKPLLETSVPTHVARCFVRVAGEHALQEIPLRAETVYLFPDEEVGCVIHRGVRTIGTRDGSDVEVLVVAAEEGEGPRRGLDHYEEVVRLRADPEKAALHLFRDRDLLPASLAGVAPRAASDDPIEQAVELEFLPNRRMRRKAERELESMKRELLAQGTPPERVNEIRLPEASFTRPSLDELPDVLEKMALEVAEKTKQMEAQRDAALAEVRANCEAQGIDFEAMQEQARRDAAGPPKLSADRELETLRDQQRLARNAGIDLPHVDAQLDDPALEVKLRHAEEELHRAYRLFGHMQDPVGRLVGERADEARRELLAETAAGTSLERRDYTGALLAGIDLAGKNLRGIYLEGADLTGADLRGADLRDAMLGRADLTKADLTGATLRGANFGRADLTDARLDGVDLDGVTLFETQLRRTRLVGASLTGAQLLEARFERVDLEGARGKRLFFIKSHLAGTSFVDADLEEVMFVEADLTESNFSRANLKKATFYKASAARSKFLGAKLDNARFVGACDLDGAQFGGATMPLSNFGEARLTGADLSMADATRCELSRAILDGATLYRIVAIESRFGATSLVRANLRGANLRHAVFHGARVASADFTGANLFGADFSGAVGDDATSFSECVVERLIMPGKS